MTEKQIIKAIELAEGFECKIELDRKIVEYKNRYYTLKDLYKWEHYPLLLYRAMGGWNQRKPDYAIYLEGQVTYKTVTNNIIELNIDYYQLTPYLTAQEQALEAALEEVL